MYLHIFSIATLFFNYSYAKQGFLTSTQLIDGINAITTQVAKCGAMTLDMISAQNYTSEAFHVRNDSSWKLERKIYSYFVILLP